MAHKIKRLLRFPFLNVLHASISMDRWFWRGERSEIASNLPFGDSKLQLVCVMPRRHAERMVSLHHNCNTNGTKKLENMKAWRNWTFDEEAYLGDLAANDQLAISPQW